ncbi:MAG TPA: helix-turn-helix transcriptional regulator [Candidatus Bathyarchaeia archaeon]|nr:helix-turn-helix transcriptional regulator [Candidatus Bathyarchaeia archaeon]
MPFCLLQVTNQVWAGSVSMPSLSPKPTNDSTLTSRAHKPEERTVMPTDVDKIIEGLSPSDRKKVETLAAQLIRQEMTLRELRRARKLSQVRVAKRLGIGQEGVSKIEKRADLMISTLRKTVEAMGGRLSLVAEFPDTGRVVLSGIAEPEARSERSSHKRMRRAS